VLRAYYGEAEAASGIPWAYLAAIHLVETRLGRIQGTSSAGAQGPMQFLPATWARYGQGDVNDDHDAILAAARLLQANGGPSDMSRALLRYNNSSHYVAAVEAYAQLMSADERAFLGYHGWQVYSATTTGMFLLPDGYPRTSAHKVNRPDG
jgi:membrane-bound lytic murein transglycosylase B